MRKRGIILILLFIFIINLVSASIDITYNTAPYSNVIYEGYDCNEDCNNINNLNNFLTKTGSGNTILIQYPEEDSYNNYYYKECLYPYQSTGLIPTSFNGLNMPIPLSKKSVCQSTISSVNILSDGIVGSTLEISATIKSPFEKGASAPYNFVPPNRQNYYKADTQIDLIVDGDIKETINKNLMISESETIQFTWDLTSDDIGSHEVKIRTNVKDCQCTQPQTNVESSSSFINVQSVQEQQCTNECPPNTCSSDNKGYYGCSDVDDDGCKESNTTLTLCETTQTCSNGACITPGEETCTDGTPKHTCSKSQTKYCDENLNLVYNPKKCGCPIGTEEYLDDCVITEQQWIEKKGPCNTDWVCLDWGDCRNEEQERTCVDMNNCGVELDKPFTVQECDEEAIITETKSMSTFQIIINKIKDTFGFELKKPLFIIPLIVLILIIGFFVYSKKHRKKAVKATEKVTKKAKDITKGIKEKVEKIKLKPVKGNDLLMDLIKSLKPEEKDVCYILMEGEGIKQSELRKRLETSRDRLEVVLKRLEKKQIIKPRAGLNPKIFFNEMLK